MNRRFFAGLAGVMLVLVLSGAATAGNGPTQTPGLVKQPKPLPTEHGQQRVCTAAIAGLAYCDAHVVTADRGNAPLATTSYQHGYSPQNLASAYNWADPTASPAGSNWSWNGQTVAIVDAYDNPSAESDLAAYRSQFGLTPCTSSNLCFRKVNQRGTATPPAANTGWGQEIDLDIEMVSAVCPSCKILLVEADSNSFADLGSAVNEAYTLGANAISNSYGGSEFFGESSYGGPYNRTGVAVTASSGDGGYGVEVPAAYNTVVAVGGTSLNPTPSPGRSWTETAWSGAGSGCSALISKQPWQKDTGCSHRTVADVSAVADPNTGVAVYDSYGSTGGANWYVFGGTSVASPIIASVYSLAGKAYSSYAAQLPYNSPGSLFDVTSGSNGNCTKRHSTTTQYLCTARTGYDGPTGLGTPNGAGGF